MTTPRLAYAIARSRGASPPSVVAELTRFEDAELALLHGPGPDGVATPTIAQLELYASVIDKLHRVEPILPLRYGCAVSSDWEFAAMLERNRHAWLVALDEVEGCDEMGLRWLLTPAASTVLPTLAKSLRDRPGTAYLASRKAQLLGSEGFSAKYARASEAILEAVAPFCRQTCVEPASPQREGVLSMAFLVPRANIEAFRIAINGLDGQLPGKRLLTGPWPPYHFAGPGPDA